MAAAFRARDPQELRRHSRCTHFDWQLHLSTTHDPLDAHWRLSNQHRKWEGAPLAPSEAVEYVEVRFERLVVRLLVAGGLPDLRRAADRRRRTQEEEEERSEEAHQQLMQWER